MRIIINKAKTQCLANMMLLSYCFFVCLINPSVVSAGTLYKWIDENGKIRYSDTLPAKQAKKSFQTIAPDGTVISTKEESKSPAETKQERAEKRRQAEKEKRIAEKKAEEEAIRQHHDNVLLMTFTDEKEIILAQDERLSVIDSVISLLKKNIITEQGKLDSEKNKAQKSYLDKNLPVPGGLAQKIEYFTEKVTTKIQHLKLKLIEREKVQQQYTKDLNRFRELIIIKKRREKAEEEARKMRKEQSYYE